MVSIGAVAASALALVAARDAGASASRRLCLRYRCTTAVANTTTEVLFVTEKHRGHFPGAIVGTFARWRPTGRLTLLVSKENYEFASLGFGPAEPLAIAGRYVAVARPNCTELHQCNTSSGSEAAMVVRVDVKTGRHVSTGDRYAIDDLVLAPNGTVAWIEDPIKLNPMEAGKPAPEVRVARTAMTFAQPTLVASSSAIEPHSLALAGSHLYWSEGGQPRGVVFGE
ncbi:MAG: hypothetical protein ACYCUM_10835 [Solirubrobacteraceae bacterium]